MLSTRAERAQRILAAYKSQISPEHPDCQSHEEWLTDVVADLMHLAFETGLNPDVALERGRDHFRSESRGS